MIHIINAGMLTTIQDAGRIGYQHQGIPSSGAMDHTSMRLANILVGNSQKEAVLECTLLGPVIAFDEDCVFSVTGADMEPQLNQKQIALYHAYTAKRGDVLTCGVSKNGARCYIAFAGGIAVKTVLGSAATDMKCHIGGQEGRCLKTGDCLRLKSPKAELKAMYRRFEDMELHLEQEETIRVIEGPQAEYFTDSGRENFYSYAYQITQESDRMGYRLKGEVIENKHGVDIVSDGIVFGSIQVTAEGQPIIMMANHQTTGGYAKIATVISADLPKLAQMRPGQRIRFVPVTLKQARKLWRRSERSIRRFYRKTN